VALESLNQALLNSWVVSMREEGLSAVSCNVYIRGINSFLSWLYEQELLRQKLRAKQLKEEHKVIQTFSEAQLKAFLAWKPKTFAEHRLAALIATATDCGIRIDEALSVERSNLDLGNLLLTVKGKGGKDRIVPISLELRKILYRWSQKHTHRLLFPTRDGGKLSQRNCLRDLKLLAKRLGITGVRVSWHTFRHTFAVQYVRAGGNLFFLQKALGHQSLTITRRYCELQPEDLQAMHVKTSILTRLK
jgi:integrase/recombinase XerD